MFTLGCYYHVCVQLFTTNFSSVHATRQKVTAQDLIFNCTNLFPNYTLCVQLHVKITPGMYIYIYVLTIFITYIIM